MTGRLLVGYLSLTTLVVVVFGVALAIVFQHDQEHQRTLHVQSGATTLATLVDDSIERGASLTPRLLAVRYAHQLDARISITDTSGRLLVDTGVGAREIRLALAAASRQVADGVTGGWMFGQRYVVAPLANGGAVIAVYSPVGIDQAVRHYWLMIGLFGMLTLAVAAAVAVVLARGMSRPILTLADQARRIGNGDRSAPVPERGPPELRGLARGFNEAVAKIDRLLEAQNDWVADASHQLRTPLAALRLTLENLEHQEGAQARKHREAALAEVDRLARITDDLMTLQRIAVADPPNTTVDVSAVIDERAAFWTPLADETQVTLIRDTAGAARVASREGRLEQVLDNLIANALAVSQPHRSITIRTATTSEFVELHVIDDGPGLTRPERARAFDRFWQGRRDGEGSGLGLAIVKRLVSADHGTCELHEADRGGIDAVVRLPRQTASAPHAAFSRRRAQPRRTQNA